MSIINSVVIKTNKLMDKSTFKKNSVCHVAKYKLTPTKRINVNKTRNQYLFKIFIVTQYSFKMVCFLGEFHKEFL